MALTQMQLARAGSLILTQDGGALALEFVDDHAATWVREIDAAVISQMPDFAAYFPGEILQKHVGAATSASVHHVPPVHGDASECSTIDTQSAVTDPACIDPKATPATPLCLSTVAPMALPNLLTRPRMFPGAGSKLQHPDQKQSQVSMLASVGSAGHKHGLCKPCGFFHHEDGCASGADCSFCHLCPRGTIEQRRRVKRQLVRAAQTVVC